MPCGELDLPPVCSVYLTSLVITAAATNGLQDLSVESHIVSRKTNTLSFAVALIGTTLLTGIRAQFAKVNMIKAC